MGLIEKYGRLFTKKRVVVFFTVITVLLTLLGTVAVNFIMNKVSPALSSSDETLFSLSGTDSVLPLNSGESFSQSFKLPSGRLKRLGILSADNSGSGDLYAELCNRSKRIFSWNIDLGSIGNDGFIALNTDGEIIETVEGDLYTLNIKNTGNTGIGLKLSDDAFEDTANDKCIVLTTVVDKSKNASAGQLLIIALLIFLVLFAVDFLLYSYIFKDDGRVQKAGIYFDWFFASLFILIATFLISQFGDLSITVKHAEQLLSCLKSGRITRFYSFVLESFDYNYVYGANYNIILYFALAVIILPLKLIGRLFNITISNFAYVTYSSFIIAVLLVVSAVIITRIVRNLGYSKANSRMAAVIFLTSTVTVFSTCGFSQLDIIPLVFVLLALNSYTERRLCKFAFLISFAIALKSFAIMIFVPLLLCAEKKVLPLIKNAVLGMSIPLLTSAFMSLDPDYSVTKAHMEEIYGFKSRLFSFSLGSAMNVGVSVFIGVVIIVCLISFRYGSISDNRNMLISVIIPPTVIFTVFFSFITWHPQWVAILTPFLALACFVSKKRRYLCYTEACASLFYILTTVNTFAANVDNYMINGGILPRIFGYSYSGISMRKLFDNIYGAGQIFFTGFAASLIAFAVITFIDLKQDNILKPDCDGDQLYTERACIYTRMIPLMLLVFISIILYIYC